MYLHASIPHAQPGLSEQYSAPVLQWQSPFDLWLHLEKGSTVKLVLLRQLNCCYFLGVAGVMTLIFYLANTELLFGIQIVGCSLFGPVSKLVVADWETIARPGRCKNLIWNDEQRTTSAQQQSNSNCVQRRWGERKIYKCNLLVTCSNLAPVPSLVLSFLLGCEIPSESFFLSLRVEFLLKTNSGYPKDFFLSWLD